MECAKSKNISNEIQKHFHFITDNGIIQRTEPAFSRPKKIRADFVTDNGLSTARSSESTPELLLNIALLWKERGCQPSKRVFVS